MSEFDVMLRLLLAVVFGGLVGVERILTKHDAGIRTHMLVSVGSAGTVIVSAAFAKTAKGITIRAAKIKDKNFFFIIKLLKIF